MEVEEKNDGEMDADDVFESAGTAAMLLRHVPNITSALLLLVVVLSSLPLR